MPRLGGDRKDICTIPGGGGDKAASQTVSGEHRQVLMASVPGTLFDELGHGAVGQSILANARATSHPPEHSPFSES